MNVTRKLKSSRDLQLRMMAFQENMGGEGSAAWRTRILGPSREVETAAGSIFRASYFPFEARVRRADSRRHGDLRAMAFAFSLWRDFRLRCLVRLPRHKSFTLHNSYFIDWNECKQWYGSPGDLVEKFGSSTLVTKDAASQHGLYDSQLNRLIPWWRLPA